MGTRIRAFLVQERKRARLLGPLDVDKTANDWYRENARPVTVVIPSYNDADLVRQCVAAIRKTTDAALVRVVVVDDSGGSGPADALDRVAEAEVIRRAENGGFAAAVNSGMAVAGENDVVVLNSDTTPRPGWLECLQYGAYAIDDRVGIVGPKLLYADSSIQSAGSHRNPNAPDWFDHYFRGHSSRYGPANVPSYVIAVTGACMYLKAEVLREVGAFDDAYEMGFEDVDLCVRAWDAGFRTLYFPAATLTHLESATRGKEQGPRELRSRDLFWSRWRDWFETRSVRDADGRIRVIYVLEETGVAGGHRNVLEHLNRLAAQGFACELYTVDQAPTWFPLHVPVRSFDSYADLAEALEPEDAIKVATWWATSESVWLASIRHGLAVYLVQDVETSYYPADLRMQSRVLASYRREFRYLTISRANAEDLKGIGLEPVVIPCGIDLDVFHQLAGVERSPDLIVSNGRWHHLKNLDLVIKAWRGLSEPRPPFTLYGTERDRLTDSDIDYVDRPSDAALNELLNRAAVYAQASRHEGFCLTVLEAMAAGAAVVCTDAHGNRDFCEDGVNCLMTPQDDVDALASRLRRLVDDSALRQRLVNGGLRTARAYSWDAVAPRLGAFYREVAESRTVAM